MIIPIIYARNSSYVVGTLTIITFVIKITFLKCFSMLFFKLKFYNNLGRLYKEVTSFIAFLCFLPCEFSDAQ